MTPEAKHDWKIEKLERRLAVQPGDGEALLDLAEAAFQKGYYFGGGDPWYDRAVTLAEEYLRRHAESARARNALASACFALGRPDEAEAHYRRAIAADPGDALALVGLGNLHRERGNLSRAIETFERAVELGPDLWQAHYNLGGALYAEARAREFRKADDWMERAIYHLVTALRLGPLLPFVGNIYKDLGELFLHTRQYQHARRFFSKLTSHEAYSALAYYYLGLTHFSLGKYKNALQHYRTYLRLEPGSAVALSKIGLCHLELGEYDRAREACQQALELEPGNLMARFTLGCTAQARGDHDEARERFEGILAQAPDYFPAYVELVKTHFLAGDRTWMVANLKSEVRAFEEAPGYDGGRFYYRGPRGRVRRRIDVLLAQLKEVGLEGFGDLASVWGDVQTDSLRFQIWEELFDLARAARVADVVHRLGEPDLHFGRELGRAALTLSQFLPERALISASRVDDDAVRRAALARKARGDDIHAYMRALDEVQEELRQYRAYLLLALAIKGSADAEDHLTDQMEGGDPVLGIAAAIALVFYGNDRAVALVQAEAARMPDPERERLLALLQLGRSRRDDAGKVIDLSGRERRRPRREGDGSPDVSAGCSLCGRGQDEVDRLMSGNRVLICNLCISHLHAHRSEMRVPDHEDLGCGFCRRSIFEVESLYRARTLLICSQCLDSCVSLLQREEIERFLIENF